MYNLLSAEELKKFCSHCQVNIFLFLMQMTMEIEIHRSLSHTHVVGFHGFFEDKDHVYILLELCRRRSLMELHKRRKALSEPEVRYFLRQTLLAVKYLHETKVSVLLVQVPNLLHSLKKLI